MSHTLHTLQMPLHGVRVVEFEGIGQARWPPGC